MRNGKAKPDTKRKDNSIGLTVNSEVRKRAKKQMPKALKVEKEREENGWVWIKNGKTKKQVHPDKVNFYLDQDWELINSN